MTMVNQFFILPFSPLVIKEEQNPHDWWGFRSNRWYLVVFSLVVFVCGVEIAYKERCIKRTALLRSFSRFW